jgi:hypothetical protein
MEPIMSTNTKHTPHYPARPFQKQKTNKKKTKKYFKILAGCSFTLCFWMPFPLVVVEGGKLSDGILAPGQGEPAPTLIPWLC